MFLPTRAEPAGLRLRDGGPARPRAAAGRCSDEGDIFAAENDLLAAGQRAARRPPTSCRRPFEALGSEARFDRVLFDGGEFGHAGEVHVGSEEEMDFLGIPGLLEPDQMRELLQQRQSDRASKQKAASDAGGQPDVAVAEVATHEQLAVLRRELNGLVAAWHHRTGAAARHHPRRAAQGVRRAGPPRSRPRSQLRGRGSTGSATGRINYRYLSAGRSGLRLRRTDSADVPAAETSQTLDRGLRVLDRARRDARTV